MLLQGETLDEESCECCVNANLSHLDYRIVAKKLQGFRVRPRQACVPDYAECLPG